jgi:hypothetical protein
MFIGDKPVTGSYTDSGKLRFPVEATPGNIMQAAVFGQWASKEAREYFDNDIAPIAPEKYPYAKVVGGMTAQQPYSKALSAIKADKDKNGKVIVGSRKKKVVKYINDLDADYYTKIILYRHEYQSDNTYNKEIVEYLNSRDDISYDEMVAILEELGMKIKNGRVYWN